MDLVKLVQEMEAEGLVRPRMAAVVSELTSVDGFIKCFGNGANEVFLDEANGFKKALGSGKLGLHGLLYPSVWKAAERAKQKYPEMESDLNGNGFDLGGSMVVGNGVPGEVLFAYNEKVFGDFAAAEEIRKVFERMSSASAGDESLKLPQIDISRAVAVSDANGSGEGAVASDAGTPPTTAEATAGAAASTPPAVTAPEVTAGSTASPTTAG